MKNASTLLLAALATLTFAACDSGAAFFGGSILTMGIVGLIALLLIIYAIIELIKSPLSTGEKVIWGIVIWVIPFIGAILFLLIGRR